MDKKEKATTVAVAFCQYADRVLSIDKCVSGHLGGLLQTHDLQDCGCNIGELAILNLGILIGLSLIHI